MTTSNNSLPQRLIIWIATIGPVGKLPVAPGTWGSALAVIIWWFFFKGSEPVNLWIATGIVTIAGIWICTKAEQTLGRDARSMVIDDVAGQWIVLSVCSQSLLLAIIAFFLFRIFDVLKPFPVGISQKLPGGLGVMIDDVLAGGYSLLVLILIRKIWNV